MADNNWVQQQQAQRDRERILDVLIAFIDENGFSPTRAELGQRVGLSEITVRRHIKTLLDEGLVTEHGPRTLRPSL
jgi:predicted ArsR family transcriptional regulator